MFYFSQVTKISSSKELIDGSVKWIIGITASSRNKTDTVSNIVTE